MDLTIRWFIILKLECFVRGNLFFHKKYTGDVAMSKQSASQQAKTAE